MSQLVTVTLTIQVEDEEGAPAIYPGMRQTFGMRTRVWAFDVFQAAHEWMNRGTETTMNAYQLKQLWDDWCHRLGDTGMDWMARMHDHVEHSGPQPPAIPQAEWEV